MLGVKNPSLLVKKINEFMTDPLMLNALAVPDTCRSKLGKFM